MYIYNLQDSMLMNLAYSILRLFEAWLSVNLYAFQLALMKAEYLKKNYHGRVYARGRNLTILLREAYEKALEEVDIIAMPTIPFTATKLLSKDDPICGKYWNSLHENNNKKKKDLTRPKQFLDYQEKLLRDMTDGIFKKKKKIFIGFKIKRHWWSNMLVVCLILCK